MPKHHTNNQLICTIAFIVLWAGASSWVQAQDPPPSADPNATQEAATSASTTPEKPPEKPIYGSTSERDNALLANAKPTEIQWLETPNEKFIGLYKEGETRKAKGALLILHAPELPQLWPAPLESLRRNLPIYGWETLTIPLPQKYVNAIPERDTPTSATTASDDNANTSEASSTESSPAQSTSADAAQSSSASSQSSLPRAQIINERVDAGITYLNKNGQYNVVILVDNSSAPFGLEEIFKKINTGTSTQETLDGPLQALIIVNLQSQEPLTKEQLNAIFSSENLPIMDVFFDPDTPYQREVRRLHHAAAMRKNVNDYRQVILPPDHRVSIDDKQGFWLEKVRGFMERKAEGTELKR